MKTIVASGDRSTKAATINSTRNKKRKEKLRIKQFKFRSYGFTVQKAQQKWQQNRRKPRPGKAARIYNSWASDLEERSNAFLNTEGPSDWSVSKTTSPPFGHHQSAKPPFLVSSLIAIILQNSLKIERVQFQFMRDCRTVGRHRSASHTVQGGAKWGAGEWMLFVGKRGGSCRDGTTVGLF